MLGGTAGWGAEVSLWLGFDFARLEAVRRGRGTSALKAGSVLPGPKDSTAVLAAAWDAQSHISGFVCQSKTCVSSPQSHSILSHDQGKQPQEGHVPAQLRYKKLRPIPEVMHWAVPRAGLQSHLCGQPSTSLAWRFFAGAETYRLGLCSYS